MRFDDRLATVMAFETASEAGVAAAWRQLIDLMVQPHSVTAQDRTAAVDRLDALRPRVPAALRAAGARRLAGGAGFSLPTRSAPTDGDGMSDAVAPPAGNDPAAVPGAARRTSPVSSAPAEPTAESSGGSGAGDGPPSGFALLSDRAGMIVGAGGSQGARGLIGVSMPGGMNVDDAVGDALRRRVAFAAGRLTVARGGVAGEWRLDGRPGFSDATGRFLGFRMRGGREADRSAARRRAEEARETAHELRNPVGAVSGFAELIGAGLAGPVPPAAAARLATIRRTAGSLIRAVDDLDTVARLDARGGGAVTRRVAVAPIFWHALGEVRATADAHGVRLVGRCAPDLPDVRADDRLLLRLLARLTAQAVTGCARGQAVEASVTLATDGSVRTTFAGAAWNGASRGSAEHRLVEQLAARAGAAVRATAAELALRLPAAA